MKEELLIMSDDLEYEFINFLKNHPPERFSKSLRNMLMHYLCLATEDDDGGLPIEMKDTLFHLMVFFDLLDKFEDKKNWLVLNTNWLIVPDERKIISKYRELMTKQLEINNKENVGMKDKASVR